MSDYLSDPYAIGLPTARVLEDVERPKGFVISKFPQATKERIEAARQNVPEIPDERIDRSTDPWTDRETGGAYELVREFFNIVDPAASGAVAFTVSDGNILGLRPAGYEQVATSVHVGNLRSRA